MSKQKDREEFIAIMAREVSMTVQDARLILRHATTLHRLAEEECSDERAYNRMVRIQAHCPNCADQGKTLAFFDNSPGKRIRGLCPECRSKRAIQRVLMSLRLSKGHVVEPVFSGDPRGAVVKLRVPSGYNNSFGGEGLVRVP